MPQLLLEVIATPQSSIISGIGYKHDQQILYVTLRTSLRIYEYLEVPKEIWEAFKSAESKGKYYNSCVRGKYSHL